MFHLCHLRDKIRVGAKLRLGVPPRQDHAGPPVAGVQPGDDLFDRQVVIAHRDVDLVKDHKVVVSALHHVARLVEGRLCRGDVPVAVLRVPGESFAHGMPCHLAEPIEELALPGDPLALDELHDTDRLLPPERADDHAEGRRGFALSRAGMDEDEAFLGVRQFGHLLALGVLQRLHLLLVIVRVRHGGSSLVVQDFGTLTARTLPRSRPSLCSRQMTRTPATMTSPEPASMTAVGSSSKRKYPSTMAKSIEV